MPITEQQLLQILPNAGPRAGVFVGALNRGMTRFGITSPVRVAVFLAQIGHESGQLTRLVENLNYSARGLAATWPIRYLGADGQPNALAQRLARNPRAIANNAYASRNGNGDEASGEPQDVSQEIPLLSRQTQAMQTLAFRLRRQPILPRRNRISPISLRLYEFPRGSMFYVRLR